MSDEFEYDFSGSAEDFVELNHEHQYAVVWLPDGNTVYVTGEGQFFADSVIEEGKYVCLGRLYQDPGYEISLKRPSR
jgi:hypothetical protein